MKISLPHASVLPQSSVDQFRTTGMIIVRISAIFALSLVLANCGTSKTGFLASKYGASASPKLVEAGDRVPVGGGYAKLGKPYMIAGRVYQPSDPGHYSATGLASWYGDAFHGRMTANGEVFNSFSVSAAHPTLPLPSYIRVTNLKNGRSIVARVNDRGPFHSSRLIDVSERVAEALSFRNAGTAQVRVDYLGKAPQDGSDDARLIATLTTDGSPAILKGDASAALMTADVEPQPLPFGGTADDAPNDANNEPTHKLADASAPVAARGFAKGQAASFTVPLPPTRSVPLGFTTSMAVKPAMPIKAPLGLALKPPLPLLSNSFKTAQIPVPVARPASEMFYTTPPVPTSGLQDKSLTPQPLVPLYSAQTF